MLFIVTGMLDGKKLKAVIPGGTSCPILTADEVEKAVLDYESMWDIGSTKRILYCKRIAK